MLLTDPEFLTLALVLGLVIQFLPFRGKTEGRVRLPRKKVEPLPERKKRSR